MKKQLIYFDDKTYDVELNQWKAKEKVKAVLKEAVKELTGKNVKDDFFSDPVNKLSKLIEVKYEDKNSLGLSGHKLIDMLEIDTSKFLKAKAEYDALDDIKKPNKNDYSHFTETDEENEKLNAINNVIKALEQLGNFAHVYPNSIAVGVSSCIMADMATMKLYPNVGWIKHWR